MSEEDKWLGDYGNIISLANFLVEVKGLIQKTYCIL